MGDRGGDGTTTMDDRYEDQYECARVAIHCCGLSGPLQGVRRGDGEDAPVIVECDPDASVGQFIYKLRQQLGLDALSMKWWCELRTFTFGTRVYDFDDPYQKFMLTEPIRTMWSEQVRTAQDDEAFVQPVIYCSIFLFANHEEYDTAKRERG